MTAENRASMASINGYWCALRYDKDNPDNNSFIARAKTKDELIQKLLDVIIDIESIIKKEGEEK